MSLSKRLFDYIHSKNLSINAFEKKVGVSQGLLAKAIKNDSSIGSEKLWNIFQAFGDLNMHWLITGQGLMSLNKLTFNVKDTYYEEEINRLNRVIVRMAKKNDELEIKVNTLEGSVGNKE